MLGDEKKKLHLGPDQLIVTEPDGTLVKKM